MSASVAQGRFREIEAPPKHGEKPFVQLVDEAFKGTALGWSNRMRLLEEATNRKIRRGDALDVIAFTQRQREKELGIKPRRAMQIFTTHFAAFAAGYLALALAWCAVMALRY